MWRFLGVFRLRSAHGFDFSTYNEMMAQLGNMASVKRLVKYGMLPAAFGGAGAVFGPLGSLAAALAGGGLEAGFGSVKSVLDSVANNPKMWTVLGGLGKLAKLPNKAVTSSLGHAVAAQAATGGSALNDRVRNQLGSR